MKKKDYKQERGVSIYELAKRVNVSPQAIYSALAGKKKLSLKKAIEIEKESNGAIKVEELVGNKMREMLSEYLILRKCLKQSAN